MTALLSFSEAVEFGCCAAMMGIIWFVQLVHYPGFRSVHVSDWKKFHDRHTGMTGLIVGPLMLGELLTACIVTGLSETWWLDPAALGGLLLLGVIWLATFFISVPLHHRLASGYDAAAVEHLIRTNWIRTAAWTVRFLLLLGAMREG